MFSKVKKYIQKEKLLQAGDKILVAVSGGADSVALLDILDRLAAEYKISLHVVHLNHLFRGEEARGDARFVREIAAKRGLPFSSLTFDVPAYCARHRLSSQDAARRVRYGVFLQIARRVGANKMALGHHQDDQVETLLLNFLRGTGTGGLAGMRPVRNWGKRQEGKQLIRPLLEVSRPEIEDYLSRSHLSFRVDKSNLKEVYLRNRVRLNLLPLLRKEYNPAIDQALLSLSSIMSETEDYLDEKTQQAWRRLLLVRKAKDKIGKREMGSGKTSGGGLTSSCQARAQVGSQSEVGGWRLDGGRGVILEMRGEKLGVGRGRTREDERGRMENEKWDERKKVNLRREDFLRFHPAIQTRILLRLWEYLFPRGKGLGYRHIESLRNLILVGKTGSSLTLPGKIKAELSYGCLFFRKPMELTEEIHFAPVKINIPGETVFPEQKVKLNTFVFVREKTTDTFASGMEADFDYDLVFPFLEELTLRCRLPGDRFQPLGMKGGKKLKDFLIDKKIPREKRESLYLVAVGKEILWVAGLEINDKYKVTSETKKILRISLTSLDYPLH